MFEWKHYALKTAEKPDRCAGFILSPGGFAQEAERYCLEKGFAWSSDPRWIGDGD